MVRSERTTLGALAVAARPADHTSALVLDGPAALGARTREVVEPGMPAYQEIVSHFGPAVARTDGAIVTFEGRVRSRNQERSVIRLHYEAYDAMERAVASLHYNLSRFMGGAGAPRKIED